MSIPSLPRKKIAFVATEDWFLASHFLPMLRAARGMGLEVVVTTRVRDHAPVLEAAGARIVPLEAERRSMDPLSAASAVARLAMIFRRERPDLVHCISLKGIVIGGAAARLAGIDRQVYALTGLGLTGARTDMTGRMGRRAIRALVRGLESRRTRYLFENTDDPRILGLASTDRRVTLVGGAGIDPETLRPAPLPPQPPLKIAVISRMLWSKGIDLAVEATGRARAEGAAVSLSLYGARDPGNPRSIPTEQLRRWSSEDGIRWHGQTDDAAAVWRDHHVCCLPSRGGEGLPRSLLEGAACGRALLTTDVPGCRSLVRSGIEGIVVPPDDAGALADAMTRLAADPDGLARMGAAARARVLDGYTERDVMRTVEALYRDLLAH